MLETADDTTFYASHGPLTEPGELAPLFDDLPEDVGSLRAVVQGLALHVFWAARHGLTLSEDRTAEVQLRTVHAKLARLLEMDPRPLTEPRPLDRRLVANCRDYSLLFTALLRHKGVPARARCGFGLYFTPDHFEDHWVCEYWSLVERRWILADAQLDELQREILAIDFDPLDVPRDRFITGGRGWQLCRSGEADPDSFGIQDMHGLWFVRGDLIRDVASLSKVETLPWDWWGLVAKKDDELTPYEVGLLDRLADLTAGDVPEAGAVRTLFDAEPGLRVPEELRS